MNIDEGLEPVGLPLSDGGSAGTPVHFGPATAAEIGGIIELLKLRPPCFWMTKISAADLRTFLRYALESPRSVIMLARPKGEELPAGYVFAIFDPKWFWINFAFQNPGIMRSILFHRLMRRYEIRQEIRKNAREGVSTARFPEFSWSPGHRGIARILGLYVRKEHRRKGIAMDLYFKLFDVLREGGGFKVEEYMGPDYPQYAGRFPQVCGWQLEQCSSGGYKISKSL